MTDGTNESPRPDRESPVGEPVIRGDPRVAGEEAVRFDPDDSESLEAAAETVRQFASNAAGDENNVFMLRGAAACAALVRGEGSYKDAAIRTNGEASVSFIRKWARVHDLPRSIRRHVALGEIAPTAAKHIARVEGESRFLLAWATLDHGLTVRQVRAIASRINEGATVEEALALDGIELGTMTVTLAPDTYRDLRQRAALEDVDPGEIIAEALESFPP